MVPEQRSVDDLRKLFIALCAEEGLTPEGALQGMLAACVQICKCAPPGAPAVTFPRWVKFAKAAWRSVQVTTTVKPVEP